MDKEEVLRIIKKTAKDGLTTLDLSDNELTAIPDEIGELKNLTKLNLYN